MNTDRLTVQDVVRTRPLSREQVLSGIATGQLPAIDVSKPGSSRRAWRMTPGDVDDYIDILRGTRPAA